MMEYLKTKVTRNEEVAPGYNLITFKAATPIIGTPGQFVMIRGEWGVNPILPRAFSLVEAGDSGQVLIRNVGPGTELLCGMREGDALDLLGPLGHEYSSHPPAQKAVLVAGGVGVAPLFFLARQLKEAGITPVFIYGARNASELPMSDDIAAFCELKVTTEDGSVGQKGLVTDALRAELSSAGSDAVVYSCGPHGMLKAVYSEAKQSGAFCEVALESPMACGMGTCKGCAVKTPDGQYVYVCTDGPVFNGDVVFGGGKND